MTSERNRTIWRRLSGFGLLALLVMLSGSSGAGCGALDPGPVTSPEPVTCQAPRPPVFPEPPESLCPENDTLVCWDPGYVVDLALWRQGIERTLKRLETCPWIEWYSH